MIQRIEELSINAWPSLKTFLHDGWVIRFAKGYTRRANSVNPIYPSALDTDQKVAYCEELFHSQNLKTTFKITPAVQPENLDALLAQRGYAIGNQTSVQILENLNLPEPKLKDVLFGNRVSDVWLDEYSRLNGLNESNKATLMQMLGLLVPKTYFVMLGIEGTVVACGMGVVEGEWVGLFDIVVDPEYRNRGIGKQLLCHIIKLAKTSGARKAYLQVMIDNQPALKLYEGLGFKEKYQYWYRTKN